MLHVDTLGKLEVRSDERTLEALLAQPKRVALLLYLVLARPRGFHRRDALLALFWPSLDGRRARSALNQALSFLRREVGDGVVTTRGLEEVAVDHAVVTCDAIAFEEAVQEERWDQALELYEGDLLPGLHVGGAEVDRWLDPERDRLRAMAAGAARALALTTLPEGDAAAAERLARRALQLAPTDEDGARALIQALAGAGYRTAALRFYDLLAESLAREFELDPSAETQKLAAAVRDGSLDVPLPERTRAGGPALFSGPVFTGSGNGDRDVAMQDALGRPVQERRPAPAGARLKAGLVGASVVGLAGLAWAFLRPAPPPLVSSFEIQFPPGQEPLDEVSPTLSLSPDGTFLAYVGPGRGAGKRGAAKRLKGPPDSQLWIKRRDSYRATPLPGTDGAQTPSVSPDGAWIAYVADHRLRKIRVGGGTSVVLADTATFDVPAWLDDGSIVYTGPAFGLRRVPAAGGRSEALWTPPDSLYAGGPVAVPGSREILFALCDWYCKGSDDYWVLDLHTRKAHVLVKQAMWAAYASTGELVYARRDGNVYAAPFDTKSQRITGTATLVLSNVKVDVGTAAGPIPDIDLGADGTLLYRTGVSLGRELEFVWVTRSGVATPMSPGMSFDPGNKGNWGWSLSPDGTRVAFRRLTDSGDNIWVEDSLGALSRITTYAGVDRAPHWSPDGTQVTFVSHRDGNVGVWTKRADGVGDAQVLFHGTRHLSQGFWTPDGKQLVLRTSAWSDSAGDRDILAVRPGVDTVPRPLLASKFIEAAPAISPDSRWIAFETNESGGSEVVVCPFPDVDSGRWPISTAADGEGMVPMWAHDGHELFYVNANRDLVSVQVDTGRHFRMGSRRVLFHLGPEYAFPGIAGSYDISPEDQRFLFARHVGAGEQGATRTIHMENWTEVLKKKMRS